ncbi:hypothetical protein RRG08_065370 [Elysia crispata]|uniref:HTH CENPB-type domain-containing protein n=1 Tax=Elysia crispata TaxID=231223 RepID=A0AAE1AG81_9GAST|nr:hypothetical protein RRG08_065370 [Elysia crispata]
MSTTKRSFDTAFKLKVVKAAEDHNKHYAAKLFNVNRRRVQEWCAQKEKLQSLTQSGRPSDAKRRRLQGGGRKCINEDIDNAVLHWLQERREAGVRVTGKALKQYALQQHHKNGSQSFKASCGWFYKFKKRHNISFRRSTHVAQKSRAITDDRVDSFLRFVTTQRKRENYDLKDIGNMDVTPVWIEMPGKSTLELKGKKEVRMMSTGHEKERITVVLSALADGTKLAPFVLLPGIRPLPKEDIPSGIQVYMCGSRVKSWANEGTTIE